MRNFPLHTALSILSAGILLGGAKMVSPSIHGPQSAQVQSLVDFAPEEAAPAPAGTPPPVASPLAKVKMNPFLLEDNEGALDHFYQALWNTEKQQDGAVTRIVHYGDSPTTADLITGGIRSQLQQRFGDAGHGFILIAKPWAWYQHTGVTVDASGWLMTPASRFQSHDGLFGLGGVSFVGSAKSSSEIVFEHGPYTRFEVWYLKQPGGGTLTLGTLGKLDTAGEAKEPGFAVFEAPEGLHEVALRGESGPIRLFGITAEKAGPGVVYDSLGLNGASITVLTHMFNQDHWAEELRHRNPDLLVINYGTNEADFADFVDKQYEKELREAIRRARAALPEASILVMSPMDRGHRSGGDIETMATIPRIVETQRRVARETGCGFFDTFAAMGGAGTMARWYAQKPPLVSADLIHPYPAAGQTIATTVVKEIAASLNRYKMRNP